MHMLRQMHASYYYLAISEAHAAPVKSQLGDEHLRGLE